MNHFCEKKISPGASNSITYLKNIPKEDRSVLILSQMKLPSSFLKKVNYP